MDKILNATIENIVSRIEKIENELEKHKKNLTNQYLGNIEPKLFVKGKYLDFDKERQSLKVLIDGDIRYYSIKNYYSKYLPFPDTPILIFSEVLSNGKFPRILSTYKGELEEFAEYEVLTFKGIKANNAIFYSVQKGYIHLKMDINLLTYYKIKPSNEILFKKVIHGLDTYFIPDFDLNKVQSNKLEILKIIKG